MQLGKDKENHVYSLVVGGWMVILLAFGVLTLLGVFR
jgi:hypothetical protein